MVCIITTHIVDMQGHARVIDKALKELMKEIDVEIANPGPSKGDIEDKSWSARKIDDDAGQRFIKRDVRVTIAPHTHFVPQRLGKGLPNGDTDVLDRVVGINLQIAIGPNIKVDQSMADDLIEHVIEEGHSRLQASLSRSVQIDGHFDLRFQRVSGDSGNTGAHGGIR